MTAPTEDLIERLERLSALESGWYANVGKRTGEQCCEAMREAAQALRALQQEVALFKAADARLHAITREKKCPRCELTKAQCADTIAEFEVERRSALTGSAQG